VTNKKIDAQVSGKPNTVLRHLASRLQPPSSKLEKQVEEALQELAEPMTPFEFRKKMKAIGR